MFGTSMSDAACRTWAPAPRINHWVYESVPGQISGCDGEGRVLLAIAADALFASRLAAAFSAVAARHPEDLFRLARPAFPW